MPGRFSPTSCATRSPRCGPAAVWTSRSTPSTTVSAGTTWASCSVPRRASRPDARSEVGARSPALPRCGKRSGGGLLIAAPPAAALQLRGHLGPDVVLPEVLDGDSADLSVAAGSQAASLGDELQ